MNPIFRYMPGLDLVRHYRIAWLRHDLAAGLSVAAVALPTGIAYAGLAGFDPVIGIYSAIFPLFAYALFGTSRQLITGPDAATCALVAGGLAPLAAGDPEKYLAYSVILSLLTGAFCILGGLARLGFIANFLSRPILTGFLNGVAVNIIVGQMGKVLGFSMDAHHIFAAASELMGKIGLTHIPTVLLGTALLILLFTFKRFAPRLPGPLIAVVAGFAAVTLLALDDAGVAIIGAVPAGLPTLTLPQATLPDFELLVRDALGIVLVSFTSAMLTARSFAAKNGYPIDVNQEFIAIGACNLASGLGQGFAVSGADSRTAVNNNMGGKSQLTGVVAGIAMLLVLLFLTAPLATLPVAALGAVLIASAIGLFDLGALRSFYRVSRAEFVLSLLTSLGVITLGALPGILVAVGLAILRLLAMSSRPSDAVLGRASGVKGFHNIRDYPDAKVISGLLLYRFDMSVVFFNADYFKNRLMERVSEAQDPVQWVILDARSLNYADVTAAYTFDEIARELAARGIRFSIAGPKRPLLRKLELAGVIERMGRENVFFTLKSAVRAFEKRKRVNKATDAQPPPM